MATADDLPITLRSDSGVPIYLQLGEQIRLMIRRGVVRPGDVMPTVRRLAVELGINANTVAHVYRDLQRDGLLTLRRGVGTIVREAPAAPIATKDFRAIERTVDTLVGQARDAELSLGEVVQILELRWKEAEDAEG